MSERLSPLASQPTMADEAARARRKVRMFSPDSSSDDDQIIDGHPSVEDCECFLVCPDISPSRPSEVIFIPWLVSAFWGGAYAFHVWRSEAEPLINVWPEQHYCLQWEYYSPAYSWAQSQTDRQSRTPQSDGQYTVSEIGHGVLAP